MNVPLLGKLSRGIIANVCPPNLQHDQLYPSGQLPFLSWAGCFLLISGSLFRSWAKATCARFFTWELTIRPDHKLCKRGPYSIVRHPSYTGLYVLCTGQIVFGLSRHTLLRECAPWKFGIGFYCYCGVVVSLVAVIYSTFAKRCVREDELLRKEFGKEWEEYASAVVYRLLPGVW